MPGGGAVRRHDTYEESSDLPTLGRLASATANPAPDASHVIVPDPRQASDSEVAKHTNDRNTSTPLWLTPRAAQWELLGLLAVAFALAQTRGSVGEFLRAFSAFMFP